MLCETCGFMIDEHDADRFPDPVSSSIKTRFCNERCQSAAFPVTVPTGAMIVADSPMESPVRWADSKVRK